MPAVSERPTWIVIVTVGFAWIILTALNRLAAHRVFKSIADRGTDDSLFWLCFACAFVEIVIAFLSLIVIQRLRRAWRQERRH